MTILRQHDRETALVAEQHLMERWLYGEAEAPAPFFGVDRTVPAVFFTRRYTRWQLLRGRIGEWVQLLGRRISG